MGKVMLSVCLILTLSLSQPVSATSTSTPIFGFKLGGAREETLSLIRKYKEQGIIRNVNIGTMIAGDFPGAEMIDAEGFIDQLAVLSIKPRGFTLIIRNERLLAICLNYGFKIQYSAGLATTLKSDFEKWTRNAMLVKTAEDEVGNRTVYYFGEMPGCTILIRDVLDGSFSAFAPKAIVGVSGWIR